MELQKAEKAKSLANQELEIARNAAKDATDALATARTAQQSAEDFQKQTDAGWQAAKKSAADSEQAIRALAFSPDGRTLATAGDDQLVHTWSAASGAAFETWRGHTGAVATVAFIRGGRLASAGDQRALLWDVSPEWTLERTIGTGDMTSPIIDRVNALDFSPDGRLLASGSGEPTRSSEIKLWKVADGSLAQEFKNTHSDTVLALDFSADGKYLASGGADKFARVIDLTSGKLVKSFEGHTHHVLGVSWKRDGRTLASSGADNVIKVWDFLTGEKKKNIEGFGKEVTSIQFISSSDQAVATGGDSQVRMVRENGESVRTFNGPTDFMYSAACTPDGRLLIAGGQDSVLRVWNAADGKAITTFDPPKEK